MLLMEDGRLYGNPCSLLELHQFQLISFGHIDGHVIHDPMNSVGGLIEDNESKVIASVCMLVLVCL